MNSNNRKTLLAIFSDPVNGSIAWARIESLLIALGCVVTERNGSAVMFSRNNLSFQTHRPHPGKESLRYRVKAVREFIEDLGEAP